VRECLFEEITSEIPVDAQKFGKQRRQTYTSKGNPDSEYSAIRDWFIHS
jgi:hypothetical protein